MNLAGQPEGVTAQALAERSGCSLRAAQDTLSTLAAGGFLTTEVPPRKGRRRGDWRNVYRIVDAKGGTRPRGKR